MHSTDILDQFDFGDNPFFNEAGDGEVVAKYYSEMEAEVAAARLRAEGIPCFLANTASHNVLPHVSVLLRLHVRPVDFERAQAILAEASIDTDEGLTRRQPFTALHAIAVLLFLILALLLGYTLSMKRVAVPSGPVKSGGVLMPVGSYS
jgi:hypothetical protein